MNGKLRKRTSMLMMIVLLLSLCVLPTVAYADSASIKQIKGGVTVARKGGDSISAFVGMRLSEGDTVVTSGDGNANIAIGSAQEFVLYKNSKARIASLKDGKTGLRLAGGTMSNNIKEKLDSNSSYVVNAGNSVMGARSTLFEVKVSYEVGANGKPVSVVSCSTVEGIVSYQKQSFSSGRPSVTNERLVNAMEVASENEAGEVVLGVIDTENISEELMETIIENAERLPEELVEQVKEVAEKVAEKEADKEEEQEETEQIEESEESPELPPTKIEETTPEKVAEVVRQETSGASSSNDTTSSTGTANNSFGGGGGGSTSGSSGGGGGSSPIIYRTLSVTVSATELGSATITAGSERNINNATVAVTAVSNTGARFVHWVDGDGTVVSEEAVYSFKIGKNMVLKAVFERVEVTLTVAHVAGGTVSVTPEAEIFWDDEVEIFAQPDAGWRFMHWLDEDSKIIGADNPYIFTISGDVALTPVFERIDTAVTIVHTDGGDVSVTPASGIFWGDEVEIFAQPYAGWSFTHWLDEDSNVISTDNPYLFIVLEGASITPVFVMNTYDMDLSHEGQGSIVSNTSSPVYYGTKVEVTAVPDTGWFFAKWVDENGDELTKDNPVQIVVEDDVSYKAVFERNAYRLTATASQGGSISAVQPTYLHGDTVQIEAMPDLDWAFVDWTDENGNTLTNENPYQFEMTSVVTVKANFVQVAQRLFVTFAEYEGGTVEHVSEPPYYEGDEVTVSATPDAGWRFNEWRDTGQNVLSKDNPYSFEIAGDIELVPMFERLEYTVDFQPQTGGTAYIAEPMPYYYGSVVTAVAAPETGYGFVKWVNSAGETVSEVHSVVMIVPYDTDYIPVFALLFYDIAVGPTPAAGGSVSPDSIHLYHGESETLTATPNTGYSFVGWMQNDELLSSNNPATISLASGEPIYGKFVLVSLSLTILDSPGGGINAVGSAFAYGHLIEVTAKPQTGYHFVRWVDGDGNEVSTVNPYRFTIYSNTVLQPIFEQD